MYCALFVIVVVGSVPSGLWVQTQSVEPSVMDPHAGLGQPISGANVIVVVQRSRDAVPAYSNITGRWRRQPIKPAPRVPVNPVVPDSLAAVQLGTENSAFSAEGRRGASLSVSGPKAMLGSIPSASRFRPKTDSTCSIP